MGFPRVSDGSASVTVGSPGELRGRGGGLRRPPHGRLRLHPSRLRPDLLAGRPDAGGRLRALRRPQAAARARLAVAAAARGGRGHVADAGQPLCQVLPPCGAARGRTARSTSTPTRWCSATSRRSSRSSSPRGADIGLFPHRERSSLAEEFEFGRRVGKIPPADVEKGLGAAPPLPRGGAAAGPALHRERDHLPPPRQPGARGGDGRSGGRSCRPTPSATS